MLDGLHTFLVEVLDHLLTAQVYEARGKTKRWEILFEDGRRNPSGRPGGQRGERKRKKVRTLIFWEFFVMKREGVSDFGMSRQISSR